MGPPHGPVSELVASGIALGALLLVWSNVLARRARVSPSWHLFQTFITQEDVTAGLAEEAADKERLAILSGENLNNTSSSTSGPDLEPITEATPLIKRPTPSRYRSWHSIFFAVLGCIQLLIHVALLSWIVSLVAKGNSTSEALVTRIIFVLSWSYGLIYPLVDPPNTVPYPLLLIYTASLVSAGGAFYNSGAAQQTSHMSYLSLQLGNALLSAAGIAVILNMRLESNGEPRADEEGRPPALDDYVTLFQWLTFTWMSPLISIGVSRAVEEADVWQLSRLLQSRILMAKFRHFSRKTLIGRLLGANGFDLFLDFILTIVSTSLAVAQPYIFNLILRTLQGDDQVSITSFPMHSIAFYLPTSFYAVPANLHYYVSVFLGPGTPTWSDVDESTFDSPVARRQLAYFYAALAFVFQLAKSQADLQHLYYSRRAACRCQAELIASIYEKALVRKDITGTVASDMLAKSQESAKKKAGAEDKNGELDERDKAVASADVGKIVSLIATDASQCSNMANFLTRLYEVPVYIIGACYLLHSLMGWSAFTGYIVFILVTPINYFIMKWTYDIRKILLDVRDKRMREMNQAIQAIKFIKFFAWESRWVDRIMGARAREMGWLRKSKMLYLALTITWDIVPVLVSLISFSAFVLLTKGQLTVAVAFPALQTFSLLTRALTLIPMIAQMLIQTYASFTRIDKYLNEDEVPNWVSWQSDARVGSLDPNAPFDDRIGCENATFKWTLPNSGAGNEKKPSKVSWLVRVKSLFGRNPGAQSTDDQGATAEASGNEPPKEFELKNINVNFKRGKLNLVSGPTGSGKSSLLSALLGEMNLISGQVFLPKQPGRVDKNTGLREDVSFCAQQPWLQHQSIRENILFGLAYDEQRYNDVLEACALTTDLALFEDGDKTEIGEKGVSLSGGQKARVALARAVYARSKTVILDDVLSAVDSHTAETLISYCLQGPLLADRTIVLVTHHVDLVVDSCAWVVQLEDGVVVAQGSPVELRERGFLAEIKRAAHSSEASTRVMDVPKVSDPVGDANGTGPVGDKAARKLVEKEEKAEGRVELKIYHVYLSASSYLLLGISVALLIVRGGGDLAQKFWMRFWGEAYLRDEVQMRITEFKFPRPQDDVMPYLGGYVLIQFVTVIFAISGQLPTIFSSLRASKRLYQTMLMSVIRAPSRWFDKTPSGRILNRFSKDIDTIDSGLQMYMTIMIETTIDAFISVCTVIWGAPLFAVPLAIIGALQYWFTLGYVSVSRDLRRIESNTRSPIISSFSELVNGISTVRAFGAERFFMNSLFKRLDLTQAANYYYWMSNRWLLFRFDALGACVVLAATALSIRSGLSPGLTGIIVTQSQGVIQSLYWTLRFYTEMEQALNSVERVHEYMDVPSEPPSIIEGHRPPAYWPSNTGGISVENLVLKYSPELEPVLQGVSFQIKPTEKIGLVGRTGSGKSTLALAFFRFVDPEEGRIIIDGIDIATIGLEDLRSRLTIIPQDAVLFAGTIRENLDPFNEHSDEDCLDSLRRVQLRTSSSPQSTLASSRETSRPGTPPNGEATTEDGDGSTAGTVIDRSNKIIITLDTQVSEGGNNFSSGQRQLIAMARALLRRSRFVVMDESTASVDFATDIRIQEAIREEFKDSILITIAHRLRTVIDYDRILVMDAGKVAEFDTPKNLIAKEDGVFRSMCLKSGDFEKLKEAADRKAYTFLETALRIQPQSPEAFQRVHSQLPNAMGIKGLTALLSAHAPKCITEHDIKTLFGRKVAVDASMSIYQFLIAVRQKDGEVLTNDAGETTSHLMGFFYRTIRMVEQGIKPMYVFDGKPPDLKAGVLKQRFARREEAKEGEGEAKEIGTTEEVDKLNRRQVRVTKEHNAECQKLLQLMGIPVIIAPSEAEAQCAELCRGGKVYAAGSEDMDTLTFNSPILLRHLTFSEAKKMPISEIRLDKALEGLDMNMSQFIELCILLGCDYLEPLKGIGPKSALKLIKEHGSLRDVVAHLRAKSAEKAKQHAKAAAKAVEAEEEESDDGDEEPRSDEERGDKSESEVEGEKVDEDGGEKKKKGKGKKITAAKKGAGGVQVPQEWLWEEAKKLFEKPDVTPADEIELSWEAPDVDGLVEFLVRDKGFNEDRVRKGADKLLKMTNAKQQGRLDSFFTVQPKSPEKKERGQGSKGKPSGGKRKNEEKKEGTKTKKARK